MIMNYARLALVIAVWLTWGFALVGSIPWLPYIILLTLLCGVIIGTAGERYSW